jgi:hypothetical protein
VFRAFSIESIAPMSAPASPENQPAGESPPPEGTSRPFSPEDLPPVEPPSAGFILQLFVVPALIVGVILGVWLLFRMSASSDQNWERQIGELRQENPHRRWRGATSLVQMLQADALAGEQGQKLRSNPELAGKLSMVLREQLGKGEASEENRKLLAYLMIALGWLDAHEETLPLLIESIGGSHDSEVRRNALTAVALIAGREFEAGTYLDREPLTAALLESSRDGEARIRQLAVYTLGLLDPDTTGHRVRTMLDDNDEYVRANAAIALARAKSTEGLGVLTYVLARAVNEPSALDQIDGKDAEARNQANAREIELRVMTLNALQAIEELAPQLSASERERVMPLVDSLAAKFRDPKIMQQAVNVRKLLE